MAKLALYRLGDDTWVYDEIPLNDPIQNGVLLCPMDIHDGRVYMAVGNEMLCHDLATGKRLWGHRLPHEIWTGGFLVADGRVIASCEDKTLYASDAATGNRLWTAEGNSLGSPIRDRYHDEVVYFSGGAAKWLYAIDARNGKTLWELDAARYDGSDYWSSGLYVAPLPDGTAYVIGQTGVNTYAIPAYER